MYHKEQEALRKFFDEQEEEIIFEPMNIFEVEEAKRAIEDCERLVIVEKEKEEEENAATHGF